MTKLRSVETPVIPRVFAAPPSAQSLHPDARLIEKYTIQPSNEGVRQIVRAWKCKLPVVVEK